MTKSLLLFFSWSIVSTTLAQLFHQQSVFHQLESRSWKWKQNVFGIKREQCLSPQTKIFSRFLDLNKQTIFFSDSSTQTKNIILSFPRPKKKNILNFPEWRTKQLFLSRAKPTRHFHGQTLAVIFNCSIKKVGHGIETKIVSESSLEKYSSTQTKKLFLDSSTQTKKKIFLDSSKQTKKKKKRPFLDLLDPNPKKKYMFRIPPPPWKQDNYFLSRAKPTNIFHDWNPCCCF